MYSYSGRECFFYILRHWKRFVVLMILGALVIGSYKGAKELVNWSENKNTQEQAAFYYERDYAYVSSLAGIYNRQIAEEQSLLEGLKDFSINSSVDDLNSEPLYLVEAELLFDSTLPDGSFYPVDIAIIEDFSTQIDLSTDWGAVAAAGNADIDAARCMFFSTVNSENTSIGLKVYASDSQSGTNMMAIILDSCESIESDFEATYAGLHMSVGGQSCNIANARQINDIYDNIAERITECESRITELQNTVNSLAYPQAPSNLPYGLQVCVRIVKYAAVGAVIGFGGALVLLYLSFYLNGKLHSAEELEYYTSVFALPMWRKVTSAHYLSRKIAISENHGMVYDTKETVDRLLANIVSSNPDAKSVLFTGTDVKSELDDIKEIVKNDSHGIASFIFAPNILTDIEAFSALKECASVVIVERIDKITVNEVKKEVEQIKLSGSQLVGSVLLR